MQARWRIAKVPLCGLIGCSTAFGSILALSGPSLSTLAIAFGVALSAMAGASLNSLQERAIDRALSRTAKRPMVLGQLTPYQALWQAFLLAVAGLLLLGVTSSAPRLSVFLTLSALAIYNGLYTGCKQLSLLALPLGAICGALPPVIGWVSSGGEPFSYHALLLFALLFLWQIPHFSLILLMHRSEYLTLPQPTLIKVFRETGVKRISIAWIGALAAVMLLFLDAGSISSSWLQGAIVVNSLAGTMLLWYHLALVAAPDYRRLFLYLNVMLANLMLIVALSRLL